MSKISERIRSHAQATQVRDYYISDWELHVKVHPLTVEDRNRQLKTTQSDPYLAFLDVITAACRDENGKRIFDLEDKMTMKKEGDPRVIERLAMFILAPYLDIESGESTAGNEQES